MSKLGVHVSAGNRRGFGQFLQYCADAGNPVPVLFAVDQDVWPDILKFSPTTLVIYRHQPKDNQGCGLDGPTDIYKGDPISSARAWMARITGNWRMNRAHYYAPLNEQDPPTLAAFAWLNTFMFECMVVAESAGLKLALYAFSAGNPKTLLDEAGNAIATPEQCWLELVPSLKHAKQNGHILILHEYGFDSPATADAPATTLRASEPHLALRYRAAYRYLHQFGATPKVVIGEASAGVGAKPAWDSITRQQWLADLAWYDAELMRDAAVLGCCAYQAGGDEDLSEMFTAMAGYIGRTPTPAPEADPVVGVVPVPEPPSPIAYARTYYLLHPSQYAEEWLSPALRADRMWTAGASAHDAFIDAPGLTRRQVIAVNPMLWGSNPTLDEWAEEHFAPGYELVLVQAAGPDDVKRAVNEALGETLTEGDKFWVAQPILDIPLRVTSAFDTPRGYANKKHEGTDFDAWDDVAEKKCTVYAAQAGVIDEMRATYPVGANYGRYIVIRHELGEEVYRTWYCHLHSFAPGIAIGKRVECGEPIGVAGSSGTTAIHLHFNVQAIGAGLSGYFIPDVIDPMSVMVVTEPEPTPDPLPNPSFVSGVGVGNPQMLTGREVEAFRIARVGGMKLLTLADPAEMTATIEAARRAVPAATLMARLFYKPDGQHLHRFDAAEFVATVTPGLRAAYAAGVREFEVHNEPNIPDEGMIWNWSSGSEFGAWLLDVLNILRPLYPLARWGYPGLSSNEAFDPVGFWRASRSAALACDWIGAHSYWYREGGTGWGMTSPDGGWHWTRARELFPTKPIVLTEFSNNNTIVDYAAKGAQYKAYYALLARERNMAGAYAFALSWPGQDVNREAWVVNNAVTQIPIALGQ